MTLAIAQAVVDGSPARKSLTHLLNGNVAAGRSGDGRLLRLEPSPARGYAAGVESNSHGRQIEAIDKAGLALAVASLASLFGVQHHGSSTVGSTFRDLGAPEALPLLTRLTISSQFPIGVALFGLLTLGAAFGQRNAKVRRLLMLVVLAVVALSAAMTVLGWYLPIFQMADRIKAD